MVYLKLSISHIKKTLYFSQKSTIAHENSLMEKFYISYGFYCLLWEIFVIAKM